MLEERVELAGHEVNGHVGDVGQRRQASLFQARTFGPLGGRVIDLEDLFERTKRFQVIGARVVAGSQDDKLLRSLLDAGGNVVVNVAHTRGKVLPQPGRTEWPNAHEQGAQCAQDGVNKIMCQWVIADALLRWLFRFERADQRGALSREARLSLSHRFPCKLLVRAFFAFSSIFQKSLWQKQ